MKTPGDRFPWKALGIGLMMLGAYLVNAHPVPVPAAEILRDGPAPPAPWRKPSVEDLLSGKACIPLEILLSNRPMDPINSYRVDVDCPKEGKR